MELIVVLAVTVVLTGLLLPALSSARENFNRVLCSVNLRQIGYGMEMYYRDNRDRLPYTEALDSPLGIHLPGELMAAHRGTNRDAWDGMGLLYSEGYCEAPDCFYCPSHAGNHPVEQYRHRWTHLQAGGPIYTNYHYAGDIAWGGLQGVSKPGRRQLRLEAGDRLILATDGWRQVSDYNHGTGMNVLRGDGSVRWFEDSEADPVADLIPTASQASSGSRYNEIWRLINSRR